MNILIHELLHLDNLLRYYFYHQQVQNKTPLYLIYSNYNLHNSNNTNPNYCL